MDRRVVVVGAGASGLAALRALGAKGLDAIAYERGGAIGGVWTLEGRPTAAYRSLHLITSRARTEFAEFPMPPGTPDYPARDQVGRYLETYATHFGLHDRVRLGNGVRHARPPAGPGAGGQGGPPAGGGGGGGGGARPRRRRRRGGRRARPPHRPHRAPRRARPAVPRHRRFPGRAAARARLPRGRRLPRPQR